jgi:hypothetical protein
MAKEQNETRTRAYRKKNPADVAEAKFISGLIDKFVETSTAQLAQAGQLDELHVLMNYRKTWRGIVADLTALDGDEEASNIALHAATAPPQPVRPGDEVAPGAVAAAGTDASNAEQPQTYNAAEETPSQKSARNRGAK